MDSTTQAELLHEIRADVKLLGTGQAVLEQKLSDTDRRIQIVETKVDGLTASNAGWKSAEQRLLEFAPKLERMEHWQAKTMGGAAVIAALAGALTGVVARLFGGAP